MKQQFTGIFGRVSALFLALLMVAGTLFAAIPALPLRVSADTTASSGHAIDFDENIMLSVFWPPTPAYINDEQYRLMADAGINWVLGAGEETLATPANQKKMLEKYATEQGFTNLLHYFVF